MISTSGRGFRAQESGVGCVRGLTGRCLALSCTRQRHDLNGLAEWLGVGLLELIRRRLDAGELKRGHEIAQGLEAHSNQSNLMGGKPERQALATVGRHIVSKGKVRPRKDPFLASGGGHHKTCRLRFLRMARLGRRSSLCSPAAIDKLLE